MVKAFKLFKNINCLTKINMNRISNLLIGITLLLCISCNKKVEKETPNGFKFTVVKVGDGVLPKK